MKENHGESIVRRGIRKIRWLARYYALCATGLQWLFVLGHMRSGSSLLVHLLNSSDEILGYGETHLEFVGRGSLVDLHDHVRGEFEKHGKTVNGSHRYVTDKILWPYVHDETLLRRAPLKIIVLVRSPEEALPSILSLDLEGIQTPREALQYYSKRLDRTARNLEIYDASFVLIRYEDLTGQTEVALQKISAYLRLEKPLKPEYDTMWSTGEKGVGDSSEQIEAGTVVSSRTTYEVDLPEELLGEAREQYRQFLASCTSSSYCVCLSSATHG